MHLNNAVWLLLFNAILVHRFPGILCAMHQPLPVPDPLQSWPELCVQGPWVSPGSVTVLLSPQRPPRLSWAEQSLTLLCTHRRFGNLSSHRFDNLRIYLRICPPCKAQVAVTTKSNPKRAAPFWRGRSYRRVEKWGQKSTGITFSLPEESKLYAEQWDFLFIFHKENILCSSFLCNLKFCFLCQYISPAARAFSS